MPGSWSQLYRSRPPTDWGLDPDKGVVAFDGARAYAVPATQLIEFREPMAADPLRIVYCGPLRNAVALPALSKPLASLECLFL